MREHVRNHGKSKPRLTLHVIHAQLVACSLRASGASVHVGTLPNSLLVYSFDIKSHKLMLSSTVVGLKKATGVAGLWYPHMLSLNRQPTALYMQAWRWDQANWLWLAASPVSC